MNTKRCYLIFVPPYDENAGGSIVLHKLCHTLNQLGEEAYLWIAPYPWNDNSMRARLKRAYNRLFLPFGRCQNYQTPVANRALLKRNPIVVYPEVVSGNPLKGANVVRWFLHKPGFHTNVIDYGKNELYFFFDKFCNDTNINSDESNELFLITLNPLYTNTFQRRSGSCYMMRKGRGKAIIHDTRDTIQIDGLSHREIAAIFNRTEFFFSYDEYTMYSQFAALCGCISIVIPLSHRSREEWVEKHPISKYGIAYGMDDIAHAKRTMHKVREYFDDLEKESITTVTNFIEKTSIYFREGK